MENFFDTFEQVFGLQMFQSVSGEHKNLVLVVNQNYDDQSWKINMWHDDSVCHHHKNRVGYLSI